MRERTDLDKKPTWYLFLAANVLVFVGSLITLLMFKQLWVNHTSPLYYVPTIACNLAGLLCCGFFVWLEARGIMNKAMHFRRKWLHWYLAALIIFIAAVIYSFIFTFVFYQVFWGNGVDWKILIADAVVTGVLTLVAMGLQRYARYKIDLDMYKRTHGELPKKEEMEKDKAKQEKADAKASSGLADSIEKK